MGIPFGAIKVVAIASRRIDFMFVRRAVAAANSAGAIAMPTRVARSVGEITRRLHSLIVRLHGKLDAAVAPDHP